MLLPRLRPLFLYVQGPGGGRDLRPQVWTVSGVQEQQQQQRPW